MSTVIKIENHLKQLYVLLATLKQELEEHDTGAVLRDFDVSIDINGRLHGDTGIKPNVQVKFSWDAKAEGQNFQNVLAEAKRRANFDHTSKQAQITFVPDTFVEPKKEVAF